MPKNTNDKTNKVLKKAGLETLPAKKPPEKRTGIKIKYIESGTKTPYPLLILENICRFLEGDKKYGGRFRHNEFSHMTEINIGRDDRPNWVDIQDHHVLEVRRYISVKEVYFAKISTELAASAIMSVSRNIIINPPKDYFTGLTWDKTPRLDEWLYHAYGAEKNDLNKAIGSNWLKGCLLYTSPSPRDRTRSRMPSSA